MHSLSLSTKQASWLGFGCNKFHKLHSSTPASQITMCLLTFVHIQELLQDACQAKYCMQTPKHARWKKLSSSVILTEIRQCGLMVLFFQTILEYLLQITSEDTEELIPWTGLSGISPSIISQDEMVTSQHINVTKSRHARLGPILSHPTDVDQLGQAA